MDQIVLTFEPAPHGLFRVAGPDASVYLPVIGDPGRNGHLASAKPVWSDDRIEVFVEAYDSHVTVRIAFRQCAKNVAALRAAA